MKREINIPEDYSELTIKQFRLVLSGFMKMTLDSTVSQLDVQRDLADYILGRRKFIYPLKREKYYLLVDRVAEKLNWLFRIDGEDIMLNFDTTVNILPELCGFVGPQSHGSDITFCEFRTAVDVMEQYNADHDEETLNALAGCLYRRKAKYNPDNFDGQYRIRFNKHNIDQYAKNGKKIPVELKYGIYLWFSNFCKYLVGGVFIIEGKEISFSSVFAVEEDTDTKTEDTLGMMSILFTLSDAGTFGNTEQTDNALLLDVMCKLLNDLNEAKRLNKK